MRKLFIAAALTFAIASGVMAQNAHALSTLPEADLLIYLNPQKILNEAAPKVLPANEVEKMRATFFDLKRGAGIDPSTLEYLVIAIRFRKPTADLAFVPPDVLAVVGGDFSSDSLLTMGRLAFGDKVRDEQYGSRTIGIMKIDQVAEVAETTPLLKSFSELGAVSLTPNSLAIGNISYLKAAVDAFEGRGRISQTAIQSLLRDPDSLMAASGSPLASFAKSFGLLGTEANPRDGRCDTRFGDFYAGVTLSGNKLQLRGALNTDNPDTAKIIFGLINGLIDPAIASIPDQTAQSVLKGMKLSPRENEILIEGELSAQTVADYLLPSNKATATKPAPKVRTTKKRRPVKKS